MLPTMSLGDVINALLSGPAMVIVGARSFGSLTTIVSLSVPMLPAASFAVATMAHWPAWSRVTVAGPLLLTEIFSPLMVSVLLVTSTLSAARTRMVTVSPRSLGFWLNTISTCGALVS